jgi:enoyl-CoA hydratase/carnithine racemase
VEERMSESVILIEERALSSGKKLGVVTLNSPATLNALTLEMIRPFQAKLDEWQGRDEIVAVFVQAAGEKAFCAGGDIKLLYSAVQAKNFEGADEFFYNEYRLDHSIHVSKKPVIIWGHGIVMGGGMGVMTGGDFRIVTEASKLAMPEISIGLFPDVGGTYFLSRMPAPIGLFLGLTGTRLNARDAIDLGLADAFIPHGMKSRFLDELASKEWSSDPVANHSVIRSEIASLMDSATGAPEGEILKRKPLIEEAMRGSNLSELLVSFEAVAAKDPWMARAYETLKKGSPTSAAVIYEQLKRGKGLDLASVFEMEFAMAGQFVRHSDFPEGVRALIVDKDQNPRWNPAVVAEVSEKIIEEHFSSPWTQGRKLLT